MKTAAEVMDRNFFYASPGDNIGMLLHQMAERDLGSVPVLDLAGRPLGVATTGEIEGCYDVEELIERLRRPAVCMDEHTPIDIAARTLALQPASGLVLVNGTGIAVGALSPTELLRATLGLDNVHASVPHLDRNNDWDDAPLLELGAAHRASEAPGVIVLSPGLDASAKRVVWAEPATNMRERLDQMLCKPQNDPRLEAILEAYPRHVRFRCLTIHDARQREQLATALFSGGCEAPPQPREPVASPRLSGVMPKVEPSAALGDESKSRFQLSQG
jgi:CBS domain-containing protein